MGNAISFVGRLGADAELKQVGSNTVLEFRCANNTGFGDREVTNWFRCTMWGGRGEKLAQYLTKGSQVFVTGELSLKPWTTREGVERISPDVNVNQLDFVKGGSDRSQDAVPSPTHDYPSKDESKDEPEEDAPF